MSVDVLSRFFALLALIANLATVLLVVARFAGGTELRRSIQPLAVPAAWLVALTATVGSLYYSEVAHFTPCKLCWYQRILMYPLVLVLGVGWVRRDPSVRWYALALVVVGAPISAWHYLQQQFPSLSSGACSVDVPCTTAWVWQFGFVSIPYMALSGFLFVAALVGLFGGPDPAPAADAE